MVLKSIAFHDIYKFKTLTSFGCQISNQVDIESQNNSIKLIFNLHNLKSKVIHMQWNIDVQYRYYSIYETCHPLKIKCIFSMKTIQGSEFYCHKNAYHPTS